MLVAPIILALDLLCAAGFVLYARRAIGRVFAYEPTAAAAKAMCRQKNIYCSTATGENDTKSINYRYRTVR